MSLIMPSHLRRGTSSCFKFVKHVSHYFRLFCLFFTFCSKKYCVTLFCNNLIFLFWFIILDKQHKGNYFYNRKTNWRTISSFSRYNGKDKILCSRKFLLNEMLNWFIYLLIYYEMLYSFAFNSTTYIFLYLCFLKMIIGYQFFFKILSRKLVQTLKRS